MNMNSRHAWFVLDSVKLNVDKNKAVQFSSTDKCQHTSDLTLKLGSSAIQPVSVVKTLASFFRKTCDWISMSG